ncbi:MAG: galactose-1-phosphate uridylyltransferase [Gaiellaceae bacterium]
MTPARSGRPGAAWAHLEGPTQAELDSCPFCEGREDRTPPEALALPEGARDPDTPGWRVRVVPNKYPAFDGHEVVVHSPQHVRSLVELDGGQLGLIAEAWRLRAAAAREDGFPHLFAGVNEGSPAGASLHHSHSQLIRLREEPPLQAAEHDGGPCRLCEYLAWERTEGTRVVTKRDGLLLVCPYAGRSPFECLVAPLEHEEDAFTSGLLAAGLDLAVEALRRLHSAEGPRPANLWLHARGHWHLEILPRLTTFAAIELGTGHYVNSLPPETAAETLRAAS